MPEITEDEIPFTIPENWKWIRINDVSSIYTGNSINAKEKELKYSNVKQGYNYIATKDVDFNNCILYENGVKIPFETNFKIAKKGATLMCIEGGSAGRSNRYSGGKQPLCHGMYLRRMVRTSGREIKDHRNYGNKRKNNHNLSCKVHFGKCRS